MNEEKKTESVEAGNSDGIKNGPSANDFAEGKPSEKETSKDVVPKSQYEELEKKLSEQGEEVGEYREWIKKVTPLIDKLNENPDLVDAIMEDKITSELAEAILAGKVKVEEATKVAEAHEEIKKELGTKKYKEASPEEIEKLITEKIDERLSKTQKDFQANISKIEEKREFESRTDNFIKKTEDFSEYADEIDDWLEEHPDQYDIEVAYNVIKGKRLIEKEGKEKETAAGEAAKEVAANAAGGQSQGTQLPDNKSLVDKLIGGRSNPNVF